MIKQNKLVIAFFIYLAFILYSYHPLNSDEGVVLNGAWNLYNGKILYKDFFEYISPGSFYFVYGIFLLFGPSYIAIKLASIIFLLITLFLIYKINLALSLDKKASYYPALFWLIITKFSYPLINHNTYSTFLAIIFTYIFILFIKKPKNTLAFYSGILASLIFYFLQTKGFFIIITSLLFILYLIKQKKAHFKHFLYFLGGVFSVFIIGILFWGQAVFTHPFLISGDYLQVNQVSYICYTLFIILIIMLWWLLKKQNKLQASVIFLFLLQISLFLSILNRPDMHHLFLNLFPLIILMYVCIKNNYNKFEYLYTIKITKIFFSILILVLSLSITFRLFTSTNTSLKTKIFLNSFKQEIGKEEIFSHPFIPGIYFELKKQNPYYTNVIETIQGTEIFLLKNFTILKEQSPKYIITNYKITEFANYKMNVIDNYIFEFYHPIEKQYYFTLWEKI